MVGGLEGCKPSNNPLFLVALAGKASKRHQNIEILGRLRLPRPLYRVSPER